MIFDHTEWVRVWPDDLHARGEIDDKQHAKLNAMYDQAEEYRRTQVERYGGSFGVSAFEFRRRTMQLDALRDAFNEAVNEAVNGLAGANDRGRLEGG